MILKKTLLACIVILVIFSCSDYQQAIFYTIENETPITDNPLPNDITIFTIVKTSNAYYISSGSMWKKSTEDSEAQWQELENVTDSLDLCNDLVFFNGNLYGAFFSASENTYGFYMTATASTDLSWESANDTRVKDKQIVFLKQLDGTHLFVGTAEQSQVNPNLIAYSLYSSTDGIDFTNIVLDSIPNPVLDIEFDGASYWVITNNTVYSGTDLSSLEVKQPTSVQAGAPGYRGVLFSSVFSALYISTSSGLIHQYSSGNWTVSPTTEVSSKAIPFTKMSEIPNGLIVGTAGYGYFEIVGGDINSIQRFAGITKTDLYHGIILEFLVVTADSTTSVYACTSGNGLWLGKYTDNIDAAPEWNRE